MVLPFLVLSSNLSMYREKNFSRIYAKRKMPKGEAKRSKWHIHVLKNRKSDVENRGIIPKVSPA